MRHACWALGAMLVMTACAAPSTLSPMAIRLAPGSARHVTTRGGLRTGPRLTVPLQEPESFEGNDKPFSSPQWAVAYDFDVMVPVDGPTTQLHLGFQGELGCGADTDISCPVPVPGYGLSMGLSHHLRWGRWSLAPAFILRGATDFGLGSEGGPGSMLGVEGSLSLGVDLGGATVGVVPFFGVHRLIVSERTVSATYSGLALAGHFAMEEGSFIELTAGAGHVKVRGVEGWWVPIFGLRGGP
ncbi:hypothetical protein HUW62_10265 [Myxococcus sp. AM011]|uniref:hypothetical protein n=1 Tax=Myxococcus sp. AM011 TaxID=2745200 RepID=UPI001595DBAA|nr:hypothetical protein [Myxococcus sp. AM011]NVJ21599.1 hypothetical protein [Myxococcus sp. AM011]